MDYKRLGLGLGIFSIALGAVEFLASRRVTRALDADGHGNLVKAFGGRELLAGANLLMAPARATNVWNRVAGDLMDIAAGTAVRTARGTAPPGARWPSVTAALGLDLWVARGLDRETGRARHHVIAAVPA
ncbi:hypothetical protein AB5I41_27375 [Sphingomonas sp. MMS24-JH45]